MWNIFTAVRVAEIITHGIRAIILVYNVTSGNQCSNSRILFAGDR